MRRTTTGDVEAFLDGSTARSWRGALNATGREVHIGLRAGTVGGHAGRRQRVHVEVADGVATITLDSPANRNALSTRLVAELNAALDVAEAGVADGDVRAIVLTHVAARRSAPAPTSRSAAAGHRTRRRSSRLLDAV